MDNPDFTRAFDNCIENLPEMMGACIRLKFLDEKTKNMFKYIFVTLAFSFFSYVLTYAQAPSHSVWDALLKEHVNADGLVDYKGFAKDRHMLDKYIAVLSSNHPENSWSKNEQMAYWINAYNAFTVKLILDNYPLESIRDIKAEKSPWDIPFIRIEEKTYDLNTIENGILRKDFKDARIHAAVNCASWSCPKLWGEAFAPSRLDQQLDAAMRAFVNDPVRNQVRENSASLSRLFQWYSSDFTDEAGSIQAYINRYSKVKISTEGKISYLDYNWQLNEGE